MNDKSTIQEATRAAIDAAAKILEQAVASHGDKLANRVSPQYAGHAAASLRRLAIDQAGARHLSYEELLALFTDPSKMVNPMSWIVLWTAIAASASTANNLAGLSMSENERTSTWAGQWRATASVWSEPILNAVKLEPDLFDTAIAHVASTRAETKTGADVLVLLWHRSDEGSRCRVVKVQFKPLDGGRTFSVQRNGFGQYDTLVNLSNKAEGRLGAMYGLLGSKGDKDTSASSVPLPRVAAALGRPFPTESPAAQPADGEETFSVSWHDAGEPLAVGLTLQLCDPKAQTYESPSEAIESILKLSKANIADYLIVQSFGHPSASLRAQMQKCTEALERKEISLISISELEALKQARTVSQKPRRPRMGPGGRRR